MDETEMKFQYSSEPISLISNVRKFLYLVLPEESSFERVQDVPYYLSEVFPLFIGLVFAEYVALCWKGESPRLSESLNSLSHGIISEMVKILSMGLEISIYIFIHQNYKIIDLPWDNPLTWYLALLGVDFAYYWAHRASHEVNFLWAQHQIHHSSEDFNIAVAVRHPPTHSWINSFFYLPLAFIIPPQQSLAHQQLNLLYQGWLHTSLVGSLGPLEYIFNTPTHHKVHHGCNLYVLDKNYGGLLIIWDRLFGTFQPMRRGEELVYGIVFQHRSHNPLWQMFYRWPALCEWVKIQSNWKDKLRAFFFGPSWVPGAPRLGRDSDKVDIKPRPKFEVSLPKWLQAYILLHFFIVCLVFQEFALKKGNVGELAVIETVAYLLISLTSIGLLSEGNPWGSYFEVFRCSTFLIISAFSTSEDYNWFRGAVTLYFIPSLGLWLIYIYVRGGKAVGVGVDDIYDSSCGKNHPRENEQESTGVGVLGTKALSMYSLGGPKKTHNLSFGDRRRSSNVSNSDSGSECGESHFLSENKGFIDQRKLN